MYHHASPTKDIKVLEPRISNHSQPWIYFSSNRGNVLVYLSNSVDHPEYRYFLVNKFPFINKKQR